VSEPVVVVPPIVTAPERTAVVIPPLITTVDPAPVRHFPLSPRTVAKTKFTAVEMREMNSGTLKCTRCGEKFSLFQAPDRCYSCDAAVCSKCSVHLASAPLVRRKTCFVFCFVFFVLVFVFLKKLYN
jgi:hypothetical protein